MSKFLKIFKENILYSSENLEANAGDRLPKETLSKITALMPQLSQNEVNFLAES